MTGSVNTDGDSSRRKGQEIEKFKRRMIRSVARRIKEKKTDQEVWEDMKKEIGSNCKKLWERMRMLTLKKLKRLLEADDRVDQIGPVARMTLTDWLLFDLVIVHEKIDVIDRDKLTGSYQSKVLMNLFALVQRFGIEGRTGENLAEAWTSATVYYNSKGHQCSPMMLQRRWYQVKELTRHKFYKFWFNYRGNQRQLNTAKLDSPDELQKAIALKYPQIITEKFLDWEERIENRMVILPDELGVKMRQKSLMKASDTTAPDVVLVEPHIEIIDLGINSDSEDEGERQNASETQTQPTVKIKIEPVDVEEGFEADHEVYIPKEKGSEFDEEIQRLQMVEENFDDNAAQDGPINVESIVIDPVPPVNDPETENTSNEGANEPEENENTSTVDENEISSFRIVNGEITNVQEIEESIMIDDEDDDDSSPHEDALEGKDKETEAVISNDNVKVLKDSHIEETIESQVSTTSEIRDIEICEDSNVAIAEISSIASAGVKVENVDDVLESDRISNIDDEQITGDIPGELLPVISTVSSAGIKVEKDFAVRNDITDDSGVLVHNDVVMSNDTAIEGCILNLDQINDLSEVRPVISTVPREDIKVEIETLIDENLQIDKPPGKDSSPAVTIVPYEDDMNEPTDLSVVEKDFPSTNIDELETFGDIPTDLNFADDGIDFADDGIAYVEEDEDDIITVRDPPTLLQSSDEEATEKKDPQKFDLKLLMCPVVYTTKLDDMTHFNDTLHYKQVYDKEIINKIYTLSKPVSKQSITGSESITEQVIVQEEGSNTSDVNDNQVEDKNYTINVSDDDLFRNESIEEPYDSDSESDVVDDSKRVKLTSYMLRKPKHRSYNPVLLCKNPDFNTRLKKLSVGFFMSTRNRTLLQSCIPMTIDMTKAFEDKLINGTLYLKSTPTDLVINFQDDIEATSAALVQPTAVQQSLMIIDDTIESELKKRMAERIRAINLPDISQVRRLNQQLLTAEVTPLRLENAVSQDDAKDYVQNIKDDIDNLLSQQKTKDVSNTDIDPPIPIEKESSPPPLVSIDTPLSRVQPTPPPMVTINSPVAGPVLAHPLPQIASDNTAPSINTTNVEDPNRGTVKVRKQSRKSYYPPIAWNKRPHYQNQVNQEYHKDALLTIDTLYKMLSTLDPCTNYITYLPKKKASKKKTVDSCSKSGETSNENKLNKDTVIDITDDETVPIKKPRSKPKCSPSIRTKDKQYCCWYRYRLEYIQGHICKSNPKRRHRCRANLCVCCCRESYYGTDLALVTKEAEEKRIEVEQEQQTEQHISQTIEHVVQHVNEPNPKADLSIQIDLDENDSNVEPLPVSLSSHNAVLTQMTNREVDDTSLNFNISDDSVAELTPLHPSKDQQPTPKFRVYSGVNRNQSVTNLDVGLRAQSNTTPEVDVKPNTENERTKVTSPSLLNIRLLNIGPKKQVKDSKPPSIKRNPCTCRPNISQVNKGRIEINGSNNCKLHKKQIKESKLLVKKLITNENQPFFVGKGKILLTNMKMPHKSKKQSREQTLSTPQPAEVQLIRLPAGVQIVLLSDQTLTYVMEPDVTLTPEEYAILPDFLVAIQQQINSVGITLPADHPVAKMNEIIDLDKDEFSSNPKSETVANTDNALNSIDPIEHIPSTDLNDVSTSEETTALKIDEDFEVEIDSLPKEKRATDHEDFEVKIDTLAVEKKNVETLITGENMKQIEKPENADSKTNESESSNAGDSTEDPVNDKDDNINSNAPIFSSAEEPTNKKSLLSDLMEMSGIMEEDLAPPPLHVITPPEHIIIDTSNFVLQRRVSSKEVISQRTVAVPSQSPVTPEQHYTETNKAGNFELTAVTSFADLKYSSDNKGLFFKLDLETGQLTSINVCIQKFSPSAQLNSEKSFIDLTDDPDISITGTTEDGSKSPATTIVTVNEPSPPKKTPISTIIQKKQRLMERLSNNLKPINIAQSKRHVARILRRNKSILREPVYSSKFKMQKLEAKIDLVDSDVPIEEEYLVSDDTSDDEPLIKKSKRIHSNETPGSSTEPDQTMDIQSEEPPLKEHEHFKQQNAQQDQSNVQQNAQQDQSNVQQNLAGQEQSNVQNNSDEHLNEEHLNEQDQDEQDLDRDSCSQVDDFIDEELLDEEMDEMRHIAPMPVPTNLVLSGGALNAHNIPLNKPYRQGHNENSDEDENCILGV